MLLNGLQVAHYHLEQRIGDGGMSEVYLARDSRLERAVALKIVRTAVFSDPDCEDEELLQARRLFQREARAVSMLDHPHILPLFDYGETQVQDLELTYLVMPYHPAGSLQNWLRSPENNDQLSPLSVVHLIDQAASALQYAHERGIVHQDVKLPNFLVTPNSVHPQRPDILLADFGVARIYSADSITSKNIRGTPVAMAPEQWSGETMVASDQYALAIMAYRLLTGRYPFEGDPMQVMYKHLHHAPPPTLFPPPIDEVLGRALHKDPYARFDCIADFARTFHEAIETQFPQNSGALSLTALKQFTGPHAPVAQPPSAHDKAFLTPATSIMVDEDRIPNPVTPLPEIAPESIYALASDDGAALADGQADQQTTGEVGAIVVQRVIPVSSVEAYTRQRSSGRGWLHKRRLVLLCTAVLLFCGSILTFFLLPLGPDGSQAFSHNREQHTSTTDKMTRTSVVVTHAAQEKTPLPTTTAGVVQISTGSTPTPTGQPFSPTGAATATATSQNTAATATPSGVTPTATATSSGTTPTATPGNTPSPTSIQTVPLHVQSLALVIDQSLVVSCGVVVTVTYTATISVNADNTGGVVSYQYTTDNGATFQTATTTIAAGVSSQQVTFQGLAINPKSSKKRVSDDPHTAWILTTDPDPVTSAKITPAVICA